MIAIPAVDLREGACVQLVGGDYDSERVREPDVMAQVARFRTLGFSWLHVVDLDRATERGDNDATVRQILRDGRMLVQVGGGVRSLDQAKVLFDAGAERVVVGTRAIADADFLDEITRACPGRVVLALDVREREIVAQGWQKRTGLDILDFIASCSKLPIGGFLVTAVHKEGALAGVDLPLYEAVVGATSVPVVASGGVTSIADVAALDAIGCSACVIGMALYTGIMDSAQLAKEFGR